MSAEALEFKPVVITSSHLKGGCGKTTILTDLGIYLALQGFSVLAIDMDMQGSMYSTLTGNRELRYLPASRYRYWENLRDGKSLQLPKTKYPEVNERMNIAHYPIQMFARDDFFREEFVSGFKEEFIKWANSAKAVLIDLPPAKLETSDVGPFKAIESYINKYYFLIVDRPTPKEVEDGVWCFGAMRQLMEKRGISRERILPLQALNFHKIKGPYGYYLRFVNRKFVGLVNERPIVSDSPFSEITQEEIKIKIPKILVPSVPKAGDDLRHYSVLLDENFNYELVIKKRPESEVTRSNDDTEEGWYDDDKSLMDEELENTVLIAQREYLRAIRIISEAIFPELKPEVKESSELENFISAWESSRGLGG